MMFETEIKVTTRNLNQDMGLIVHCRPSTLMPGFIALQSLKEHCQRERTGFKLKSISTGPSRQQPQQQLQHLPAPPQALQITYR